MSDKKLTIDDVVAYKDFSSKSEKQWKIVREESAIAGSALDRLRETTKSGLDQAKRRRD